MQDASDAPVREPALDLKFLETFAGWLESVGVPDDYSLIGARILAILLTLGLAWIAYFITRTVLRSLAKAVVSHTANTRDDLLLDHGIFKNLSHLTPAIVIYELAPEALSGYPDLSHLVITLSFIYMVIAAVRVVDSMLNFGRDFYNTFPMSRQMPINAFIQVAKLIVYLAGVIWVVSILIGKSPLTFIAGLGAMTAVLLLVFQSPILGFVAGIQLAANRMLSVGDWITMEKYGLDGDVMEIGLTTVKVRNFDKTIVTVPTQSLVNDSFRNWRGMKESGGRRIKRAVDIDLTTIRFLDDADIERLSRVSVLKPYIEAKLAELSKYNDEQKTDPASPVNGRRMTNIGTFRAYVEAYLKNHPMVSQSLTFLIRQLEPTADGLPLEIYVFTTTTNWADYERIQADIFDHIFAAAPEFGLRIFQHPSGADIAGLGNATTTHQSRTLETKTGPTGTA